MKRSSILFCSVLLLIGSVFSCSACTKQESTLQRIEIVKNADKLIYEPGDSFDATGLEINAIYSNGTVEKNVAYKFNTEPVTYYTKSIAISYKNKIINIPIEIYLAGNDQQYDVSNVQQVKESPLSGRTYYFLGSSVTEGSAAEGQSMVDFLAKKHGCTAIKNAVSGTTLLKNGKNSYVDRLDQAIESNAMPERIDAFICQLSTNDKSKVESFGEVTASDVLSASELDTSTTFGAIEYIIVTVRQLYDCPIVFYTNSYFPDDNYQKMIEGLEKIQQKHQIEVLDLYRDANFNDISKEQYDLYMFDEIHPYKIGYRDWWTPAFEAFLISLL